MPLFMVSFSFTTEAWQALVKNPQDRRETVAAACESVGCTLREYWYALGEHDGHVVFEAPDDEAAAAFALAAVAGGSLKANRTTRLFTTSELQDVLRAAGGASYRAVGT